MFSDFECPYCLKAIETIERLESEYPGEIHLVYKAFPIAGHPNALIAALVAHVAHDAGKFWEFQDLLYGGQRLNRERILDYAMQVGIPAPLVATEIEELTHATHLRADLRQGKRLDVTSTPVFFINGRRLRGAKPIEAFRMVIDQELALAQREEKRGLASASIYAHLTRFAYTEIVYPRQEQGLQEDLIYPVPVGDSPQQGPDDALITIIAFEDFQCPYCVRGHQVLQRLKERYGDKIRLISRQFPLPGHPLGALAARGSFYAQKHGKYWDFHARVYAAKAQFEVTGLQAIASQLGLDAEGFAAALSANDADARIMQDMELGRQLGIRGTPAYFVNGRPLVGARPLFDFRMLISEELQRAQQARAQGIAATDLYRHLVGLPTAPVKAH